MLFNLALFGGLLLTPVVLAVPYGLGGPIARRSYQSQVNARLEQAARAVFSTRHNSNWAGAVWAEGNDTFSTVTGTFTIPTPSSSTWASAAAWVGIDGDTCTSVMFQTGIAFTVVGDQPIYSAWYEWYPADAQLFVDISISPGDVIKLTVIAWSATAGTATIVNLTNGQVVSKSLSSSVPLCGQNVEWIVADYSLGASLVPLANFGTVTFTNAVATGTGTYTPSGATIVNVNQDNRVLTSVSTNGTSVTIQYV